MSVLDPGLQTLFVLLRGAGIAVGLEEIRRLGAVFAAAPALDEDGLRQVVEAVVVKSVDQQASFRHVYRQWLDAVDQQIAKAAAHDELRRQAAHKKGTVLAALSSVPEVLKRARSSPVQMPSEPALLPSPMQAVELPTGPIDPLPETLSGSGAGSRPGAASGPHARRSTGNGARQRAPWIDALGRPPASTAQGALIEPNPHPTDAVQLGPVPARAGKRITRGLMLLTAAVFVLWYMWPDTQHTKRPKADAGIDGRGERAGTSIKVQEHKRRVYVPELRVVHAEGPPFNYMGYGLAALALVIGAGLWLRRGRGRWLPVVGRAQEAPGITVATHAAPVRTSVSTLFLDSRDEENLVWGVGRFISDEQGRDLDVSRTVSDTAAAYGRPVLRYASARYQREVWLWVDESLDSPAARHLARDLIHALEGSGLPVVRANFWGIPYQLVTETDEVVTVDELDARRDTAVVAVLTDGRLMHAAHRARERGEELRILMRNLSFWPRVTFIDFGHERGRLAAMVEPLGLPVIKPQDAPAAISDLAGGGERAGYERLVGDARVWAAACALSPRAVDDPTALMLRRLLGLQVSPWAIETLRQSAHSNAGGLSWSHAGRAALLSWLLDAEDLPERGTLPPGSLLARIVSAWDRLLDERERAQRQSIDHWVGSTAQEHLRMERAFLHLWDRPDEAAAKLYELFHRPRLQPIIRYHLGRMAPREGADHAHSIPLPWSLRDRRRETQVMLTEMGFGVGARLDGRRSLPRPGRLLLALGLCVGAFMGAAGAIVEERLTRVPHEPELVSQWPKHAKLPFMSKTPAGKDRWMVEAWTPWPAEPTWTMVETEQDYVLQHWAIEIECVDSNTPGMEIRRCCNPARADEPVRGARDAGRERALAGEAASGEPWRLVILRRYTGQDAKGTLRRDLVSDLADELLCSGTADAVYLLDPGAHYPPGWSTWGHEPEDAQLLIVDEAPPPQLSDYSGRAVVVALNDVADLLTVTEFAGKQSLAERELSVEVLAGSLEDFEVLGRGPCGEQGQRCCAPPDQIDLFVCNTGLECEKGVCVAADPSDPADPADSACPPGAPECGDAGAPGDASGQRPNVEPGRQHGTQPDVEPGRQHGKRPNREPMRQQGQEAAQEADGYAIE